jgi:DNA-binding NtrC family response regulator
MAKILFVDDQINVLNSLKRTVEDEDCEVYTALSAKEGLKLTKEHTFDVIFSDIKMPELDGIAFLAKTREIQPDSVRIVLSAYADREQVLNAVNKGFVWGYQTKPWDSDDLILTLRNGIDFYQHQIENKRLAHELQQTNKQTNS